MSPMFSHILLALLLFFSAQPLLSNSRILKSEGQAFYFLQNTEQVQRGQTITGLNDVKKYLSRFGYYPTHSDSILNDEFDDILDYAIKTYQDYHKLAITGKFDNDTMKKILTPRCGVADITNMTYTKPINGKKDMFFTVANYAFPSAMQRWSPSKYQLTYTFKSGIPVEEILSEQEVKSAFSQAFRSWEGASRFKFQEVPEGSSADIVIGFFKRDHGDGDAFDGPGMVLAHSFFPEDGRSHYDGEESWSTNPDDTQMDLQSVVLHELGHVLGLGHSRDPEAIMYSGIAPGTIKRELTQDDIDGIQALYDSN
ncbi:Metalloendoproteinase 3-MMP [Euphorbia peplus]|nr:Metalloendoproteinase 3-MMP [Euphorbia peplus]